MKTRRIIGEFKETHVLSELDTAIIALDEIEALPPDAEANVVRLNANQGYAEYADARDHYRELMNYISDFLEIDLEKTARDQDIVHLMRYAQDLYDAAYDLLDTVIPVLRDALSHRPQAAGNARDIADKSIANILVREQPASETDGIYGTVEEALKNLTLVGARVTQNEISAPDVRTENATVLKFPVDPDAAKGPTPV